MKILKKKIPSTIALASVFVIGALTYSIGYNVAMNKFNSILAYNQEKEQMYYKLSEIDRCIRQDYINDIDEQELISKLNEGYVSGLNDRNCKYLTEENYKKYSSKKLYDENAVVSQKIDDDIGYIKIRALTPESGNMFSNSVKSLFEDDIKKIVVDIRGLSGSDLNPINKCLDSVVSEGNTVSTINKKGEIEVVYKTTSDGLDIKFSVITNSSTSGTPELIASALKDSQSGTVIGERTAGNATKEKVLPLSDGAGIVFPSDHYVTKSNQILTGKGVSPDIEVTLIQGKKSLLEHGKLLLEDDDQFQEAVNCLNK